MTKKATATYNNIYTLFLTALKNANKKEMKEYYTYKEAAAYLKITVEGLRSRIKRGQMFKVRNLGRPMIAKEEIQRFLKQQNPD